MKKIYKVLLSSILIMSASSTYAKATDESVLELMKVTHINEIMEEASNQGTLIIPRVTQQIVAEKQTSLDDKQKQKLNKIINDYVKQMHDELDTKQNQKLIKQAYISAVKNHFTQEEVDAQVKFYGSEVGQSILKKKNVMIQDYMSRVMPELIKKQQSIMKSLLPKLEADIKTALKKKEKTTE